ncbi:hypothetical protein B0J11DRAFT_502397 [Dendryphion nanum]|uniref:Uncharacterized protein n=1 Tax=Dendryphion nanum TaxID=256645 RepID=A0A9P9EEB7_9PLEO|nr:hypothetical protein B0J11DRAFT_502397 [Dendryphion nanum]
MSSRRPGDPQKISSGLVWLVVSEPNSHAPSSQDASRRVKTEGTQLGAPVKLFCGARNVHPKQRHGPSPLREPSSSNGYCSTRCAVLLNIISTSLLRRQREATGKVRYGTPDIIIDGLAEPTTTGPIGQRPTSPDSYMLTPLLPTRSFAARFTHQSSQQHALLLDDSARCRKRTECLRHQARERQKNAKKYAGPLFFAWAAWLRITKYTGTFSLWDEYSVPESPCRTMTKKTKTKTQQKKNQYQDMYTATAMICLPSPFRPCFLSDYNAKRVLRP